MLLRLHAISPLQHSPHLTPLRTPWPSLLDLGLSELSAGVVVILTYPDDALTLAQSIDSGLYSSPSSVSVSDSTQRDKVSIYPKAVFPTPDGP